MGIQSTIYLSREEAEQMWIDKQLKGNRKILEQFVKEISNDDLETQIEKTFYNYAITS